MSSVASAEFVGINGVRLGIDLVTALETLFDNTQAWGVLDEIVS